MKLKAAFRFGQRARLYLFSPPPAWPVVAGRNLRESGWIVESSAALTPAEVKAGSALELASPMFSLVPLRRR